MAVGIADVEIAAAIGLILRLALDGDAARDELLRHRVDVIDIEIDRPILVERRGMLRPCEIEEDRDIVPADDAEGRRLAEGHAGTEAELLAIERFAAFDVLDLEDRSGLHELGHASTPLLAGEGCIRSVDA